MQLQEAVEGDRKRADATTGGVMDPVGNGSGDADEADLADAFGSERRERIRFPDEDDVDVRSVGVDRYQVVAEGGVGDPTVAGVDDVLLEQRLADAADGAADDLAAGSLLVEDAAGVGGRRDACDADEAEVLVDADLDELGRERGLRWPARRPGWVALPPRRR
jgi:hypothetical protein